MTEIKSFLEALTSKGFPSIKKLINFVFPPEGQAIDTSLRKWIRTWARYAPFIALGILAIFYFWARLWVVTYDIDSFAGAWFIYLPHAFAFVYSLAAIAILLVFASILKIKRRDSSLLLALTPIAPFKALLFVCGFHIMYAVFGLHRPDLVGPKGKTYLLQKAYKQDHPNESFPGEKFFGFMPGKTTYAEALEILKNRGGTYHETLYKGLSQLPLIEIISYQPFEKLYNSPDWFEKGILAFDSQKRLYSIKLIKKQKFELLTNYPIPKKEEIIEKQTGLEDFRAFLKASYWPLMQKAGFKEKEYTERRYPDHFYTPAGIKISISTENDLTVMIKADIHTDYMESSKEQALQQAELVAANKKENLYVE